MCLFGVNGACEKSQKWQFHRENDEKASDLGYSIFRLTYVNYFFRWNQAYVPPNHSVLHIEHMLIQHAIVNGTLSTGEMIFETLTFPNCGKMGS
jgi:hypothetical protein